MSRQSKRAAFAHAARLRGRREAAVKVAQRLIGSAFCAWKDSKDSAAAPLLGGGGPFTWAKPDEKITAGELRLLGIPVPESIPDCAWIKRGAISTSIEPYRGRDAEPGDNTLTIDWRVEFTQPFNWIELDVVIVKSDDEAAHD